MNTLKRISAISVRKIIPILALCVMAPSFAFACPGIPGVILTSSAEPQSAATNLKMLTLEPRMQGMGLRLTGNGVNCAGMCQKFDMRACHGVRVRLLDSGEVYDGRGTTVHQEIHSGNGDDIIYTADKK